MDKEMFQRLEKIENEIKQVLPKQADGKWFVKNFGTLPQAIEHKHIEYALTACNDLVERGGKRWRPILMVLCAELENPLTERVYKLTPMIELIHTASLIHDDIEDNSNKRRGEMAIHLKYGVDVALNSASWLYFQALSVLKNYECTNFQKAKLYDYAISTISALHLGQNMDISWHQNNSYIPTHQEYEAMIALKTGALSKFAGLVGIFSETGNEDRADRVGKILQDLGVAFQIIDDITNITVGIKGKDFADDIVEGKKSLPTILHVEEHPEDLDKIVRLFNQAREEGPTSDAVLECVNILKSGNAINKSKQYAQEKLFQLSDGIIELYGHTVETRRLLDFIEELHTT